jgi:thiamine-phosphate diphosphorylase
VKVERLRLPRLYAILDAELMASRIPAGKLTSAMCDFATELATGGVNLMQYRAGRLSSREMLSHARELRRVLGREITLLMNDRSDLCLAAAFDGVHLDQDALSPEGARTVLGTRHWIGLSTRTVEQVKKADAAVDYIAIDLLRGEFERNPDPIGGFEQISAVRNLTSKPLVVMGGGSRAKARGMIEAGADAIAVTEELLEEPKRSAEEFLAILV